MQVLCMFRLISEVKTRPNVEEKQPWFPLSIDLLFSVSCRTEAEVDEPYLKDGSTLFCLPYRTLPVYRVILIRFRPCLYFSPISTHRLRNEERERERAFQIFIHRRCDMIDWMDGWNAGNVLLSSLHRRSVNSICLVCSISLDYLFSIIDKVLSRASERANARHHRRVFKLSERE